LLFAGLGHRREPLAPHSIAGTADERPEQWLSLILRDQAIDVITILSMRAVGIRPKRRTENVLEQCRQLVQGYAATAHAAKVSMPPIAHMIFTQVTFANGAKHAFSR
jgi:hypothetical protein